MGEVPGILKIMGWLVLAGYNSDCFAVTRLSLNAVQGRDSVTLESTLFDNIQGNQAADFIQYPHQFAVVVQEAHSVGDVQDAHGKVLIPASVGSAR